MELKPGARFEPVARPQGRARSGLVRVIDPPGHDVSGVRHLPDAPGGPRLLIWSSDIISLCDPMTGERIGPVMEHEGRLKDVQYVHATARGPRFVSWSKSGMAWANSIRLWDASTCELVGKPIVHEKEISGVWFVDNDHAESRILSASWDGAVRTSDAATGERVGELQHGGRVDGVLYVANAPGGARIVSWTGWSGGTATDTVRMWDAVTGAPIGQAMQHSGLSNVVHFPGAPQGPCLATWSHGSDRAIRLWDAVTGSPVGMPMSHEREARPCAFVPDGPGGACILSVDEGRAIRMWDAARQTLVGEPMADDSVRGAAYLSDGPDGPCILSWSLDGSVRLWDAVTHRPRIPPMKHEGIVFESMYIPHAPGGPRIVSWSSDCTARLWSAKDGAPIGEPMRHKGRVSGVLYLPDAAAGPCIVTSSDEDETVRLWDAASARPMREPMRHDNGPWGVQCPPGLSDASGAPLVLTWDSKTVRLWDTAAETAGAAAPGHEHRVEELRYLANVPGGARFLTRDLETVRLWDAQTAAPIGAPMQHVKAPPNVRLDARVDYVDTTGGPRLIVSSGRTGMSLWNGVTTEWIPTAIPHGHVAYIPDLNDGVRMLTWSSEDATIGLWSAASGAHCGREMRHDKAGAAASYIADAPDGPRILSWSCDGTARWWNPSTGDQIGDAMRHEHICGVMYLARDRRVLTWSGDNVLRYWDAASGRPDGDAVQLKALKAEVDQRRLQRLEYLPDAPGGPRVVTWFEPWKVLTERTRSGWSEISGVVRVWDATTGEPAGKDNEYVAPATHPVGQTSLTYLPGTRGGPQILSWSGSGLELWDAATGDTCGEKMWHDGYITAVSYVAEAVEGPRIVSAAGGRAILRPGDDNTVRLWDAMTGKPAGEAMGHDDVVIGCQYLSRVWDAPHILSWTQRSVHVWNALTCREVVPPTSVDHAIGGAPLLLGGNSGAPARLIVCTDRPHLFILNHAVS